MSSIITHLTFVSELIHWNMEQGRLIWNLMDGESFLDTTIICCDGYIKTNKCFLVFSDPIVGCICGVLSPYHQEVILMMEYTTSEVFCITKNFCKTYTASQNLKIWPYDENQEVASDIAKSNYNREGEETIQNLKFSSGSVGESFVEKTEKSKSDRSNTQGRSESKVCTDCGKIFTSSKQMRNHKYNVHPEIKDKYECEHCLQKFPYVHVLNKHKIRRHSGERFVCSNCNKSFTIRSNLLKHIKIFHEKS